MNFPTWQCCQFSNRSFSDPHLYSWIF